MAADQETRTPREAGPDPESGLHADIATPPPGEVGPEPAPTAVTRGGSTALVASAVLPGAGQILAGDWRAGAIFVLAWGALLGGLFLGWPEIVAIRERGSLDDWVALVALVSTLVAVWLLAFRGVRREAGPDAAGGDSQWAIARRQLGRNGIALIGLATIGLLYVIALLAPFLAPYDPIAQQDIVRTGYLGPSLEHWFGTDRFGRDVLTRILYGARISLAIGFIAVAISITLGVVIGAVAGYLGGKTDALLMRFTDTVLAFPRLVLLIMIIAVFSPSLTLIILVLGLTQWPGTTRIVRGEVLSLREREFIQAARALGFGRGRIIARHLIPNVLAPVIVTATLGIGNTIVLEAGLSFLGMGVQPPTPSWGSMVADGRQNLLGAWWVATFPGLAIVVTVVAFNLVGDALRDALDPRLRQ
ncbi:MAG: ABC transporter permease [Longimicrobiales bacterium]